MAQSLSIHSDSQDNQVTLLKKILQAINLFQGGITNQQARSITVDDTGAATGVTIVASSSGVASSDRVGGFTTDYTFVPAIDTNAYVAGDALGIRVPMLSVLRSGVCTGLLQSLTVYDADGQKAAIDFLIFDSEPSSSTIVNNSAVAIAAADIAKLVGKVSILDTDYVDFAGGAAVATVANIGLVIKTALSTGLGAGTVWIVPMVQGTPTYTAATSLTITAGFLQD